MLLKLENAHEYNYEDSFYNEQKDVSFKKSLKYSDILLPHDIFILYSVGAMSSMIVDGENGFHFEPRNVDNLKEVISRFNALSTIEKNQMRNNDFENYKSIYSPIITVRLF